jgi:hypothetical protein
VQITQCAGKIAEKHGHKQFRTQLFTRSKESSGATQRVGSEA